MLKDQRSRLSSLEGRRVSIALVDGSRLDHCELVSAGRHQVGSVWLFADGDDRFIPTDDIVDLWEAPPDPPATDRRSGDGGPRRQPPSLRGPDRQLGTHPVESDKRREELAGRSGLSGQL